MSDFYARLPVLADFTEVGDLEKFAPLPDDWHVALCDVRNSTAAVEAGRYKNVNTVGAAMITAVLNAAGPVEVPFIFEGDGAMVCVPAQLLGAVRAALVQTRRLARDSFGLELRIATVPVATIRAAGRDILVTRYRVSEHYVQAVFAGGGMAWADRHMKDPATADSCAIDPESTEGAASYAGLECRWQDIPSRQGETLSVIVKALSPDPAQAARVYRDTVGRVRAIYGEDEACHPVWPPNLVLTLDGGRLANEVGVQAAGQPALQRWLYLMRTRAMVLLGAVLMRLGLRTAHTDWGSYKQVLARNTDVRKVNDCFRQIISGTAAQRAGLEVWLEEGYARGDLVYGLHVSDRAQMTCLVFDYSGRHLHFIDGADGGLFMAAKALKARLARLEN